MRVGTLTIFGVGLIGGSIGLAARRRGMAGRVIGVGRRQASLDRALAAGAIDEGSLDLAAAVRHAQLVVVCSPVDYVADQVLAAAPHCPLGALLTDAGSTKAAIVGRLDGHMPEGVAFVGSHPLAGSEKRGPEHADADLFQGRLTLVTPGPHSDLTAVARTANFWGVLGSHVRVMDAEEHDRAMALTSHLPHLVASALASVLPPELHELTATGFRDTTRVAAGDPSIWTGIFLQNRDAVLAGLGMVQDRLAAFRAALETQDRTALDRLLAQGKKVRDALGG
jgi:cyclohexadieny/prephenate dehydrogenase